MAAAVHVGLHLALKTHRKGPAALTQIDHIERHGSAAVNQGCALAQLERHRPIHALCSSQADRSATECATWRGANAVNAPLSCAP